jgi:predicted nucleic acid-binding protein
LIVIDSSAAVDLVAGFEPRATWIASRVAADPDLHAPHLLDLEVANALRRFVRLGELVSTKAEAALAELKVLDITRYPHAPLLDRVWELRDNLTAYDAVFVALAEILDATLVTTDDGPAAAPGTFARIDAFPG